MFNERHTVDADAQFSLQVSFGKLVLLVGVFTAGLATAVYAEPKPGLSLIHI